MEYSYNSIGGAYGKLGDFGKALENYRKSLNIRIESLGPEHFDVATSYNNIAFIYFRTGDYKQALTLMYKAREIQEKILDMNSPYLQETRRAIEILESKIKQE